jgi:predicted nucleic acid-binding protein
MGNKVYLDTNIVADIIDSSRTNHKTSLMVLKYLVMQDYMIHISEDILTTLYYISKDKKQTLTFFKNLIFIDWEVLTFSLKIIKEATDISLENNVDLEDVLQCLCAKENGCKILITNDKKFYDCGIDIMTVEDFCKKYDILQ